LKFSRKVVRALIREAKRSRSHKVVLRLVVSFTAKPRPVVRFYDIAVPLKHARRRAR
jgi:hypothetical protein